MENEEISKVINDNTLEAVKKTEEFLLEVRKYLETVILLSEKKLKKNKENLENVEYILKEKYGWVDPEEPT